MSDNILTEDLVHRAKFKRQRLAGLFVGSLGILVIAFALFLYAFAKQIFAEVLANPGSESVWYGMWTLRMFVFVPIMLLSFHFIPPWARRMRRLGKKYYSVSGAQDVLAHDNRPVVLYLRSFKEASEDELRDDLRTPEEILASMLTDVGPFIAVGDPRNQALALGASRFYLKESVDWHEFVKGLMRKAGLIVISPEFQTEGLQWEIVTALKGEKRQRVLFQFLPYYNVSPTAYQGLFSPRAGDQQPDMRLWVVSLLKTLGIVAATDFGPATMFLFFDKQREPRFIECKRWLQIVFGRQSAVVVRETLRPLLKESDLYLRWMPTMVRFLTTPAFHAVLLMFGLLLALFRVYVPLIAFSSLLGARLWYALTIFVIKKLTLPSNY